MQSLWNDAEAARYDGDLGQRVYTSRLLGRDPALVLHGGGNTSVKSTATNLFGEEEAILYVKGSGWDLATIEPAGFSPVRLAPVLRLAKLPALSDPAMANALRTSLTDAASPSPSVETILHAILPPKFVDHTHADAVVTLTNTADGAQRIADIYGDSMVIIPYVMPGFKLARLCAELFPAQAGPQTMGMILLNHGAFTFGATAREAYERMIALVDQAEKALQARQAWHISVPAAVTPAPADRTARAALRRDLSTAAGFPLLLGFHEDNLPRYFTGHEDVVRFSQQGPATPDHVIRTKRLPLLGRDVTAYTAAYRAYFADHATEAGEELTMVDPAPRVVLDAEWGLGVAGSSAREQGIIEDIYRHTIEIILRGELLGGYRALGARDLFEMEYWDLEQAKLRRRGQPPPFSGEVGLVTGAASGIGRACAQALLDRGAAVVGLDLDPAVVDQWARPDFLGLRCDVTAPAAVAVSLDAAVKRYGGVDMVVLNAGVFPAGRRLADLDLAEWRRVLAVNVDANLDLLRELHPLLAAAPRGGRVVVIGSKNVAAPGPGAAAYSSSKAALTQLARVAALEWGADGIRVNVVHPNAVFDTGIWSDAVLQARAAHYGLTVADYKSNNLLRVEVTSRDVGALVAEMCGALFSKITGAQVPLDGGNERVV